ncbi:MAG: flagellar basal body-associated protein FliL [Gemmobacter sp.]
MAEAETPQDAAPQKRSRMPLILGGVLAIVLGGAGFFATYSGMILGGAAEISARGPEPLTDLGFVPVDPVVISLGPGSRSRHLRMTAQLEVGKAHASEVTLLMPRILDVLNGYLRAIEIAQIEDPAALIRIRAQLLRRIQMVTGEGRVRDLLITEFVLN